jgi:NAD(P)H-hydrate repair Nnr-like enzyme with NAD(P)H-hydrate epimerase domain
MNLESEYVTVAEMRKIDLQAVRRGIKIELLMENTGKALATKTKIGRHKWKESSLHSR